MSAARFFSVTADIAVTIGQEVVQVRGKGETITVEFSCLSAGYKVMLDIGWLHILRSRVARLSELLVTAGLSLVLRTPSRKIATIGTGGSSLVMTRLGFPNVRLHLT